jgi:hypothetical protein
MRCQNPTQGGYMYRQVCLPNRCVRPNARDQLLLGDEKAGTIEKDREYLYGTTSNMDRLSRLQEKPLFRQQAKWSEDDFSGGHHGLLQPISWLPRSPMTLGNRRNQAQVVQRRSGSRSLMADRKELAVPVMVSLQAILWIDRT